MDLSRPTHTNRLANATSPYLLQHAHNPVDWYPWGEEAFERARQEDRPILLSVGYSACHWCHVMERESFQNEAIASVMNEHFVCIKVDREERPDVDDLYMAATLAMNGSGGWPMTVFLTPEQKPFFAGTYFPPEDGWGRPGFRSLLERVALVWSQDRSRILHQADQLTALVKSEHREANAQPVDAAVVDLAIAHLESSFDPVHGGFGPPPKFPPSAALSLLLARHARSGNADILAMVTCTLDAMHTGGMYDQLQGGFARYSTDREWLVPHFEKMLYDNAALACVYLKAYLLIGRETYQRVAVEVLDYVLAELRSSEGAFTSSLDADSDGEEGKYYVWTRTELEAILEPEQFVAFSAHYGVEPQGNWEGKTILTARRSRAQVAESLGWAQERFDAALETARRKALTIRRNRVSPPLDDKIITAWNGLMIGALAIGFRVTRHSRFLEAAEVAAHHILNKLSRLDGGLYRTARDGVAHIDAFLEDYAYLCDALVDLYEAGSRGVWLREARRLVERLHQDFYDPDSGRYFTTAHGTQSLVVRRLDDMQDGATPAASAVAARAMMRLARHWGDTRLADRATRALHTHGGEIRRWPGAHTTALCLVEALSCAEVDVVVVGNPNDVRTAALCKEADRLAWPNQVTLQLDSDAEHDPDCDSTLALGRTVVGGIPTAYVCRRGSCGPPITTPEQLGAILDWARTAE